MVVKEDIIDQVATLDEKYATSGPLTRIFRSATARVLDQMLIVGEMEQTISMLVESTNLSYKTVEKTVKMLISQGYMEQSRRVGNAQTYVFKIDNHLSTLMMCAQRMQLDYIKNQQT